MQMKVQTLNMLLKSINAAKLLPEQWILNFLHHTKPGSDLPQVNMLPGQVQEIQLVLYVQKKVGFTLWYVR